MSARTYTAGFSAIAITAIQDAMQVGAASDATVEIIEVMLEQYTDYGDLQAEGLPINLCRHTTTGSGGTSVTPRPHSVFDVAFAGTATRNNTTVGSGTRVIVQPRAFNIQAGFLWVPSPDGRITIKGSTFFGLELPVAPADSITCQCSVVIREIN